MADQTQLCDEYEALKALPAPTSEQRDRMREIAVALLGAVFPLVSD